MRAVSLIALLLLSLPAWANHGYESSPCTDIPRQQAEMAYLDSIDPEVPAVPDVTQEEHDRLEAKWLERREIYRAHLEALQVGCGVTP